MAATAICRQTPKVGAVCPNRARTDLCGGRPVMGVPTAIDAPAAHRLRPWATRRCAAALPTAATLDRMPTAFDHEDGREEAKTTASPRVTFLREATRPDTRSVAV